MLPSRRSAWADEWPVTREGTSLAVGGLAALEDVGGRIPPIPSPKPLRPENALAAVVGLEAV